VEGPDGTERIGETLSPGRAGRNFTRVTAPGKLESEEYMAREDAPERLFVRVEAKKK
jgi:hypothetical protein